MELAEAKKLINSPVFQRYISAIDKDAEAALKEMKATLGQMRDYPSKYTKEYKDDGDDLDKAWEDFNLEWNKIVFGKSKDGKAAMVAYKKYVIKLTILEEQNVRFGAYVEADVAKQYAIFIAFLIALLERMRKTYDQLQSELKEIETLLKKAEREVTEAKAQRIINLALTAVTLCIPGLGLGARIGIAVGSFTLQMGLDAALGPGKPGIDGTLNNAAGDAVGVPKQIGSKLGKAGSALSALYTLKLDTDEIDDAIRIVETVKKRIRSIQDALKRLDGFLGNDIAKLETLRRGLESTLKDAAAQSTKYTSAEGRRLGLLKELAQLN